MSENSFSEISETSDALTEEDLALSNLRRISHLIFACDLEGLKIVWTWRESLLLFLQLIFPITYGLLDIYCSADCWPTDLNEMVWWYDSCERVNTDAFIKARWNSWSNIIYVEFGILVFYQWFCDRGKAPSQNFWCFPFGLGVCLIYLGLSSFNYHASLSTKANFHDRVATFTVILWFIVSFLYFIVILLVPQRLLKTYWLYDMEFTFFKILIVWATWIGLAWNLNYGWTDKSCSDTLWLISWLIIRYWTMMYVLITLEIALCLLLVFALWFQKKKFLWRLPFIAFCFQASGFLIAKLDFAGMCISGEKRLYSTSIFQGVGLMHVMTGIAIFVGYYFLRSISLLLWLDRER